MKRFKKILKLSGLMLLILLASVGIGIGGGIPVPTVKRKEDLNLVTVEMLEMKEDASEQSLVEVFKH